MGQVTGPVGPVQVCERPVLVLAVPEPETVQT